ncbi:DUF4097 family beta strand repeat-containing protein [Pedobacter sp.]|uniref:DUF4097 family beta strand repeat-containing protein n=1 Tax=Pedobacter sp. TaxID=1411316 RepID=UPI003D7FD440
MKPLALFVLLISFSCAVNAQFNAEKEPLITRSLKGQSITKVNARTSGGSINVEGVPAGEARLEIYVRPSGTTASKYSKEELQKKLDEDYSLEIMVANQTLNVSAKSKNKINWKKQLSVSYRIYVPQNINSNLNTSGGSIRLAGLTGSQDFTTSGGSLHIEHLNGEVNGRTSGGSIHAENSSGTITLSTSGGSLNLSGLKGTIKANTSGGSISGNAIQGELITSTSGGSVNLTDLSCSLEATTSGGSMNVSLKQLGKYVNVSSAGGNVKVELPGNKGLNLKVDGDRLKVGPLKNFSGQNDTHSINGTLNGGGIPVKIEGSSSVSVVFL